MRVPLARHARTARRRRSVGILAVLAMVLTSTLAPPKAATAQGFDFDTGNAFLEVFIPFATQTLASPEAPKPNDASLLLRLTTLGDVAAFDAIAPYHPTAVGIHSRLDRQPPKKRTQRNKNIALLYAMYRTFLSLQPGSTSTWRAMLESVGLNPDDNSMSSSSPVGIGNQAGNAVVAAHLHDGMNQLGDEGGRKYHRQPYADYTGYAPVNTAYELVDPSRWQPLVQAQGNGTFRVQQFVTPQSGLLTPFSFPRSMLPSMQVPPPVDSDPVNHPASYKAQADNVLAVSAGLTDEQKALAELFDHKIRALGFSQFFISAVRGHTLDEFIQLAALANIAGYDVVIPIWSEKRRHDAVRPFSAIRYLYGDQPVTAWGGPGQGTVTDITGNQWASYLPTADHPEYPSGSAGICSAFAQAMRRFFNGNDQLNWDVPIPAGSSVIEPGITPAADLTLHFATWTQFENDCGQSRLLGGVHFQPSIDVIKPVGTTVGNLAYEFVKAHIDGTAPPL